MAEHGESGESVACPYCGGASQPLWSASLDRPFRVLGCERCRLGFTVPRLAPEDLLAYYPESYYGKRNVRFHRVFERMVAWFRLRRARKLRRLMPTGRILDVGCGRGQILAALRDAGWQTMGVELCESAVVHARDVLGLDVRVGPFEPQQFPDASFDVVVFWHVLEHLDAIGPALEGSARILAPGGVLVIAVPNLESWQAWVGGPGWFHLDLPRHCFHFRERWFREQLPRFGFRVADVNHFVFEQNPYGWIQSVLNRIGIRHNLLYDLMKSRRARSIANPWRKYPVSSALSLAGFVLLLPFAIAMMIPEVLFHRGGTIELYAIREG